MHIGKSSLSLNLAAAGAIIFLVSFPTEAQNAAQGVLTCIKGGNLLIGSGLTANLPLEDYAEILQETFGAEASLEVRPSGSLPLELSCRLTGEVGIPADNGVTLALGTATLVGADWRFALPRDFSLVPAAEAGSYAHWLKAGGVDPMPNAWLVYFDPLLRVSLSLRYTRGNLEFELAPTFSVLFERSGVLPAAGFRAGIYHLFK